MRIPFLSHQRRVVRRPRIPTAIPFTMEDFAEMQGYAVVLAPYGITWRVDAMDKILPEIVIIYRNSVPIFQLWRSTAGFLLHCLDTERDAGTIELRNQDRAWCLVCCLTTPPVWLDDEREATTGQDWIDRIGRWIGA